MGAASEQGAVEAGGQRIAFLAAGSEGPPVLFLHGFGADRLSWLLTQREAAGYARTVAIDLPGHGQSDRAVGTGDVSALATPVAAFVETRGAEPVHIVGHSLGGAIAIDLAHRRPDLVASLFLLAPAGLGEGIDRGFLSALTEMETLEAASDVLARLVVRRRLISPQMTARALAEIAAPGTRDALRRVAERLAGVEADLEPAVAALAGRELPKAVVWGAEDTINPLAGRSATALGGDFHRIEDAGHLPHIESHAEVNGLLRTFLARAEGA